MDRVNRSTPSKPLRAAWLGFAALAGIGTVPPAAPKRTPTGPAMSGTTRPSADAPPDAQPRAPAVAGKFGIIARVLGLAHLIGLPRGKAAPASQPSTASGKPQRPARAIAPAPAPQARQQAASRPRVAIPPRDHARVAAAARAAAFAAGVATERARWRAIFDAAPAAAANLGAFVEVAADPAVSVPSAVAALAILPSRNWHRPERAARNPSLGPAP